MYAEISKNNFESLPIQAPHVSELEALPIHHRDPFDRMLIAQARSEGLTLVTNDKKITQYDIEIMMAE